MPESAILVPEGLTRVRLTNFKIHEKTGWVDIAPLTILLGPNSTGKSAFLHALLVLKQSVESGAIAVEPLALTGRYVDLGSFEEMVYRHETSRNIGIEFRIQASVRLGRRREGDRRNLDYSYNLIISYDQKQQRMLLSRSEIRSELGRFRVATSNGYVRVIYNSRKYEAKTRERVGIAQVFSDPFGLLRPFMTSSSSDQERIFPDWFDNVYSLFRAFSSEASSIFRDLGYVGPLRVYPQRYYQTTGESLRDVGTRGERAIEMIQTDKFVGGEMLKNLEEWLKKLGVAEKAEVKQIKGGLFSLDILDPLRDAIVNITDVGFGVSQIVPIIVEAYLAPPRSTIMLEQPEIHLHPKAQATLADLLIDLSNKGKKFIVETHSEHLLLRLQRRVAEGRIPPERVAVYYFEPKEGGVTIKRITLDSSGQFMKFPKGFMEEALEEAYKLAQASDA